MLKHWNRLPRGGVGFGSQANLTGDHTAQPSLGDPTWAKQLDQIITRGCPPISPVLWFCNCWGSLSSVLQIWKSRKSLWGFVIKFVVQLWSYFVSLLSARKLINFKPKEQFSNFILDQLLSASPSTMLKRSTPRFPCYCTRHLPNTRSQQLARTWPSSDCPASSPCHIWILALSFSISGEPFVCTHAWCVHASSSPSSTHAPSPSQLTPRPPIWVPADAFSSRSQDSCSPVRCDKDRSRCCHQRYLSMGWSLSWNGGHCAKFWVWYR